MKMKRVAKGIYFFKFKNQYESTFTMMRLQEYYESPLAALRGKALRLEKFMDVYAKKYGNFTYFTDWAGFNVPDYAVRGFEQAYYSLDMTDKEFMLLESISRIEDDKYYIIASHTDDAYNHEVAHAFYYLRPQYKKDVDALIDSLPASDLKLLKKDLLRMGYSDKKAIIYDETQAYLATSNNKYFLKWFKRDLPSYYKRFVKRFKQEMQTL